MNRGLVDGSRYEILFTAPESDPGTPGPGWIRTRTVRAGQMLTVRSYPMIVNPQVRRRADAARARLATTPAQQRVNEEHSRRRFLGYLENNFGPGDVHFTGTYDYGAVDFARANGRDAMREMDAMELPDGFEDAQRDRDNFIARVRRAIRRLGGDPKELRYMWVIEAGREQRDGPRSLPRKYHLHMVMGHPMIADRTLTRDAIEGIWRHGLTRVDSLQMDRNGLARLAAYLTKQRANGRKWGRSRNLKPPKVTVSDRRMSRRRSEMIARDVMANAAEIYGKLYPGYALAEQPQVRFSSFIGGAYICARLRQLE